MDRKFLKELGIEDEQIDKIMEQHGATVNPLKQKEETLQTEVDNLKTDISERDDQLTDLQGKVGNEEDLKATIESLKTANSEKDAQRQQLLKEQKLDYEVKIALNNSGARNERAVKALLDLDAVKINEDGQLTGLSEQLDNLKASDDYLFTSTEAPGDKGNNDPKGSGDYVPGSDKKGNGGKETTDEEYAQQKLAELFPQKEEK